MSAHPISAELEAGRLAALAELSILDSPPERDLDGLTRLAAMALNTQSAAISLVDDDRQWFKARHAIPFAETPREIAFCDHTVRRRETLVVPDARIDPCFKENPLVTGEPGIRFYAGAPLFSTSGHCIGSLCVLDGRPREKVEERELAVLEDCARLASQFIESRRQRKMGEIAAKVVLATSDAILAADRSGTIVYWNPAAKKMFGYTEEQALGQNVKLIIPKEFHGGHQGKYDSAVDGGPTRLVGSSVELQARRSNGQSFPVELSLARWGTDGEDGGFAAIVRDITTRKTLERDRTQARAFLDTIVTNLPAMLFVKDAETRRYLLVNRKMEELTGRSADGMIGRTDGELFPGPGQEYEQRDEIAARSNRPTLYESTFLKPDGSKVDVRTTRVPIDGPERPGQYILGMSEDTTQMRRAEAQNTQLAWYDALTGLQNRASFSKRLRELVLAGRPFAMLSIDLDRFKAVNDQFGHLAGDAVLQEIGDRLIEANQEDANLSRIGGDEFIALLTGDDLRERANRFALRAIESVSRPIRTERVTAHVGASIGAVRYPDDGRTVDQLRENADLALYRAKHQGRNTICFFDGAMDTAIRNRKKMESNLRAAIEGRRIRLKYQPVISATTGEMTSVEALARWDDGVRGDIAPDEFIAVAEDCGLIDLLGKQLLEQACTDAAAWRADLRVAVNLSPLQFQSGELVATVRGILEKTRLPANRLLLEVTERLVIQNAEQTFAQLEELRALGIQILMDDFGVGHSSLSYFQRFPFDKVKIDKSFVTEVEYSPAAKAIVQAVVGLGRDLAMGIVAEGIETESQKALLIEMGCTHLQGYLFSKPLDPDAIPAFDCAHGTGLARYVNA